MAQRPHELGDFKACVDLRLNFRLKGYVSRQCLWTLDKTTAILFAAGSFHTKNLFD